MRLDIYVHIEDGSGNQQSVLAQILAGVLTLNRKADKIMATEAEFKAAFARVDTATTGIATLIRTLVDRPLSGMTQVEEDAVKAKLEGVATALEAMAATPTDPVPVPVPDPLPPTP